MARKVEGNQPAEQPGADDLEVLHPERQARIAGRDLVMREYGFVEGLKLRPLYLPLLDSLKAMLAAGAPDTEQIIDMLAGHADVLPQLVAAACDQPVDWVAGLDLEPGYHLLLLWWGVNGPFFTRSAVVMLLRERGQAGRCAGAMSTLS